jgi:hypothetical protein
LKRSSRARLGVEAYLISFEEHLYHSFPREEQLMKKQIIEDRRAAYPVTSIEPQELSSPSATEQLQQALSLEKARRVSSSRPLEVLHYEPGAAEQAQHLLSGWHLLFFARAGSMYIQDLQAALQQESEADVQLLWYVQRVQAQYREYMAHTTQAYWESVAAQEVIAEICYGSMSLIPGFWLPEEMELGLSLLPKTGGRLVLDRLALVAHCLPSASQSLDVLLVTAPSSRTKAELTAHQLGDRLELAQERHLFTFSTPLTVLATFFGEIAEEATGFAVAAAAADGGKPPKPSEEDIVHLQAERVRNLGDAPAASQLIEALQHLLTGGTESK